MPVIAIVAAGAAWASAAGAVGALATAGTLSLAGALEITAAVGATLGAVGVVTKDKGLTTAGMILGGIGGIGQLAVGAGLFGADAGAESVFGSASDVPANVSVTAENPGLLAGESAAGTSGAADVTPGIVDSLGGTSPVSVNPLRDITGTGSSGASASDNLTNSLLGKAPTASTGASAPPIPSSTTPGVTTTPASPAAPSGGATPPVPGVSAPASPGTSSISPPSVVAPVSTAPSTPGLIDKLGNFISNDKSGMIGYGLIQAGGSLVGGLFDPLKPAQVNALNAQTAGTQAQTAITNTQAANIKAPIPTARLGMINTGVNV